MTEAQFRQCCGNCCHFATIGGNKHFGRCGLVGEAVTRGQGTLCLVWGETILDEDRPEAAAQYAPGEPTPAISEF